MKQVTIEQIAKEAGVSIASVSRAINNQKGIGEETRKHILEVCERMNYISREYMQSILNRKTPTLGIIMPDILSPFYSRLMVYASDIAHKKGYRVLLCSSFRDAKSEEQYLKLLVENQVEGILVFPVGYDSSAVLCEYIKTIPIVSLHEMSESSKIPYVCTDEYRAGKIATEHLISSGCKNLLFVGFKPERFAHRCRAESFLKVARENRIPAEVYECGIDYRSSFDRGYKQFQHYLMERKNLPDGIVAASDASANGILKACREDSIRIPEDLSLIGFDNISVELPLIEISTVAVSHEKLVERAMELLFNLIGKKQLSRTELFVKMEPKLVEKKSCK